MTENVARMLEQAGAGSRIVLWEQNLRLARRVSLGARLAGRYGHEMVVIGFAFHQGSYNTVGATGDPPGEQLAKPSSPGSLEWACHSTGIPRFILDLRSAIASPEASAWLAQPLPMRNYVSRIPDPIPVGQYFDALIYFDHTTPSAPLP